MPLHVLGISHHTAPVEVRERVAINSPDYGENIRQLMQLEGVEETVIIGTCNRTEFYCLCTNDLEKDLLAWVHDSRAIPAGEMNEYFYQHSGENAVRHLIRVAGGLDSLVLGEPQILGQIKEAWQHARDNGGVGRVLDRLFQHTFAAAKSIRTSTGIGERPVSVAYTAVTLARQIFGDLSQQTVVLVGAGEMIRLCGQHLKDQRIARLEIINRSLETAQSLASELNATASTLDQLDKILPMADILFSSTASQVPIINRSAVKSALKSRRHRPMFMVDIAVPRDIAPDVAKLDNVYLYTIDDLQKVVDENIQHRSSAAEAANMAVEDSVDVFMRWLYGIRASRSLKRIRTQSHAHETELVVRALKRLQAGHEPEQILTQMANTLTNRILHEPTQRLREAAEEQKYEILKAADWIFRSRLESDKE
ncbi:MAG TPA: glutamyl-tRNA reductase [Xanthomonadales bacterium]|nr:glutamyl-tRNA reductase [Xanthomonadales bacterium]